MPKASREKGKRLERGIPEILGEIGIPCIRTGYLQGTGAARALAKLFHAIGIIGSEGLTEVEFADNTLPETGERIEAKSGKQVPQSLYKWIEGQDALIVKRDREVPLLIVRLDKSSKV